MSTIYLDNAATTKVRDEIVDAMSTIIKNEYGNPSSTHSYGRSVSYTHLTLPTSDLV